MLQCVDSCSCVITVYDDENMVGTMGRGTDTTAGVSTERFHNMNVQLYLPKFHVDLTVNGVRGNPFFSAVCVTEGMTSFRP
jgi:hypothetical protein